MGERYMKESEIYRSFIDFWDKGKTFGECLDAVPKYTKEDILGEVINHNTGIQRRKISSGADILPCAADASGSGGHNS